MATRWWKHFEDMITRFDIIHERDIQQRDRLTLHDGRGCVYHDLCIASRGKNELASRLRSVQVGGRNKRSWHYTDKKTRWCAVERRAWHWSHLPSRSLRLASPHATSTSSYHVPPTAVMWAERACPKASLTLARQTVSSVHPCLFQTKVHS